MQCVWLYLMQTLKVHCTRTFLYEVTTFPSSGCSYPDPSKGYFFLICMPTKELLTLLSHYYTLSYFTLIWSWVIIVHKCLDHGGTLKQCLYCASVYVELACMHLLSFLETDC